MKLLKNITILLSFLCVSAVSASAQGGPDEKKFLVSDLVEATYSAFPSDFFRNVAAEATRGKASDLAKVVEGKIAAGMDADQTLTAAQRADGKARLPEFAGRFAERMMEIGLKGFDIEVWIKEALAYGYSTSMTTDELKQVSRFLNRPEGKAFLRGVSEEALAKAENRESKTASMMTAAEAIAIGEFAKSPVGEKFSAIFDTSLSQELEKKTAEWSAGLEQVFIRELTEGELAQMLKDFKASVINPKK